MRLATLSQILLASAASATLSACVFAQANITPGSVRDQLNQSNAAPQVSSPQPQQGPSQAEVKAPKKPAAPAPKAPATAAGSTAPAPPAAPASAAPAKGQAKAPAKPAPAAPGKAPAATPVAAKAKTAAPTKAPAIAAEKDAKKPAEAAKETAKDSAKPPAAPAAVSAEKAPEEKPVVRRDPFDTLLTKARAGNAPPENLPPGKSGLIVETLRIDGIVHSPNGMIAIVSNPQQRVYFLRDGDKLYDGAVDRIALDSISFHEVGKDAFGKPLERTVTKQLYPSSGEQQ
jgi:Tfp pilus assembly protein PilP